MIRRISPALKAVVSASFMFGFCANSLALLDVGSDGSDGAINLSSQGDKSFNMAEAVTGVWNMPSPTPGKGVYDPNLWVVVYKFSSFTLYGGNITFQPHPSGCPVVILVQNNFSFGYSDRAIYLNGQSHNGTSIAIPGPGGFRGGAAYASAQVLGSAGFGPGGADYLPNSLGSGGSHGTLGVGQSGPAYGNETCIPLVGGSGGSGAANTGGQGGAAGGGAILIACGGTLQISGHVYAPGGTSDWGGGGAGGTIRLIGDRVEVPGTLSAYGGNSNQGRHGGAGRIRIESNTRLLTGTFNPLASITSSVPQTPQLWPTSTHPALRITSVGGINAPEDPRANLFDPDIPLANSGNKLITVIANNVPTDGSWIVQVRLTPRYGEASFVNCTFVSGNQASSTWQGTLNFDGSAGALIARAYQGP